MRPKSDQVTRLREQLAGENEYCVALNVLLDGRRRREIAARLSLSENTVAGFQGTTQLWD